MKRVRRSATQQAWRYVIVGLANAGLTFLVIWLLHRQFGVALWFASAAGYALGALQGFLLSRGWSFANPNHHAVAPQALGFIAVNILCMLLFSPAVVLFARVLPLPVASVVAAIAVMPVSFGLYRWVVFRGRGGPAN
jgi:putative flippase GtrA